MTSDGIHNYAIGSRIPPAPYLATYDGDNLHFYLNDWLGTRRVQTDYSGVVEQDCMSLPYGDSETCGPTPAENLYTGKARDAETAGGVSPFGLNQGNDYFGARYYSSVMGRWLSPDWSAKADAVPYAVYIDPQSLNLYVYIGDNPLARADIDGHQWMCISCLVNSAKQYAASHPRTMQALKGAGQVLLGAAGVGVSATAEVGSGGLATAGVIFGVQGSTALAVKGVVNIIGAATNTNVSAGTKGIDSVANPAAQVTTAVTGSMNKGAEAGAISDAAVTGAEFSDIPKSGRLAAAIKTAMAIKSASDATDAAKEALRDKSRRTGNCSSQNACN